MGYTNFPSQITATAGVSAGGDLTGSYPNPTISTVAGAAIASTNTASTIVKRDGSGNFAAGAITGNLTGNASGTAASFTGSLVGDVSGTQGVTAVNKINGVSLAGLATGLLKNTTTTGAPSIAVGSDVSTALASIGASGSVAIPLVATLTVVNGIITTIGAAP